MAISSVSAIEPQRLETARRVQTGARPQTPSEIVDLSSLERIGGGAGIRTRVRKYILAGIYMRISF